MFDSISTPADLVALNNSAPATADSVYEHLLELDAPEALSVLTRAIAQLAQWHQNEAQTSDTPERARAWASDEGRLHIALLALNEVEF